MNERKYCFLIVAPSGTGKDTVVKRLCDELGYTSVRSYTTRPPRDNDENDKESHTFVGYRDYLKLPNKVAITKYNGYYYCATKEQIDDNDFYIVDLVGLKKIKQRYNGEKELRVIGLIADTNKRIERMQARGDHREDILKRVVIDEEAFEHFYDYVDTMFFNDDLETCVEEVKNYIQRVAEGKEEELDG